MHVNHAPVLLSTLLLATIPGSAQHGGQLHVGVDVVPASLSVTVTSDLIHFGQQNSASGAVFLDPVTGQITEKAGYAHQIAEMIVAGDLGERYSVVISATELTMQTILSDHSIAFQPSVARSDSCTERVFSRIDGSTAFEDSLPAFGCAVLRFGGFIEIPQIAEGSYTGIMTVSILAL